MVFECAQRRKVQKFEIGQKNKCYNQEKLIVEIKQYNKEHNK